MDKNNLIGTTNNNSYCGMPWHNKEDLKHFKERTLNQTIVMGYNTYKSLKHPLKNRKIIILSKNHQKDNNINVEFCNDFQKLLSKYYNKKDILYVAGGKSIYELFLPYMDKILISRIDGSYKGETYFPSLNKILYIKTNEILKNTFILENWEKCNFDNNLHYTINRKFQYFFIQCIEKLGFNNYGDYFFKDKKNIYESNDNEYYENEIISISSYYWGENKSELKRHNFIYKPYNIIIDWYKYPLRSAICNIDITEDLLIQIFKNIFTYYNLDTKIVDCIALQEIPKN